MYSIIEIVGGIGKNIMATAVISEIKKKHPERKLLVITAYPEVFLNNIDIYRTFKFGACPYFYTDYVENKDVLFFCAEPYRSNGYLKQNKHLIESWCDELNLPCNKNIITKLYLTHRELQAAKNNIKVTKPILIFQPFGGVENSKYKYGWNRDLPSIQAQQIVDCLSTKYHIVQPVHNNKILLNNCEHVNIPLRDLFGLIYFADSIIGIDSCVQHIAKAMNKHATVCWVTNNPIVYGYNIHKNILPKPEAYLELRQNAIDGYFHEYDFMGTRLYDYPFKDDQIFNIAEIVEEYYQLPND